MNDRRVSPGLLVGAGVLSALGAWLWSRRARTYPLLDPALRSPLLRLRSPGLVPALLPLMGRRAPGLPALDGVTVERREVPGHGNAPPVPVYVYRPEKADARRPAVLYIHGGGYVIGSATHSHAECAGYARDLGAVVVSPEYRLAPGTPFPGPLEDVYAALKWLCTPAVSGLNTDPRRVALVGESAGGGLAASLAALALDRGEVCPVFQLLLYPMLDDRTVLRADHGGRGEFVWTPTSNRLGWSAYLGHPPGERAPAYAAAARREDLRGLPPAWIGVGSLDLFYEEDRDYARRLNAAGVPCTFYEVPGAYHGFPNFSAGAAPTRAFARAGLDALRAGLGLD